MPIIITLSAAEYEQITCDIENAVEEFEQLSSDLDYYVTDMPERLRTVLEIINREQD